MIDLFTVKLNGEYDEIGPTPTIENGLFLCDTTGNTYTRGYSYEITDGTAQKIDKVADYKIQQIIYSTIESVCNWLNNWFLPYKNSCGCSDALPLMPKEEIKTGDLVKAESNGMYFIGYATVQDDVITIDNPLFNPEVKYAYSVMNLPPDVESAISQMIYYDIFTRGTVDGLKSENIGNYSYTKEDTGIGSLAYPHALVAGLEMNYRRLRFVQ